MRQSSRWVVFAACVVLVGPFLVRQAFNRSKPTEEQSRNCAGQRPVDQESQPGTRLLADGGEGASVLEGTAVRAGPFACWGV